MSEWTPPPTIVLGGETWRHFPEADSPEIFHRVYIRGRGDNFRYLHIDDHELKQRELLPKLKALVEEHKARRFRTTAGFTVGYLYCGMEVGPLEAIIKECEQE